MIKRNLAKIVSIIALIALSIVFATMSQKTSFGADIEEKAILEGATNKYINYELDNGKNGTLVQYQLRTGVEYGNEFSPIKNSELNVSLNQIDNKYPYDVRVIFLQTKVTNGNMQSLGQNYTYDVNTGLVTIKINNENENGEPIYNQKPTKEDRDEFLIMAYYDTYTQENLERELSCNVEYKATLFKDDNRQISGTGNINQKVTNNIGELTSIITDTSEIYNGYIKSNIVNGTSYNTEYTEKNQIVISKKDVQQKIKIYEENTFVNLNDIYYKTTKFQKNDILNLLGEEGKIEVFDANNNIISTIDKNTEFDENGEFVITYNEGINSIYIKTSDIINEGVLRFENEKYIKSDNNNLDDKEIISKMTVIGIKEEKIENKEEKTEGQETENNVQIVENTIYETKDENVIDIKDSTTKVEVKIDNEKWTNEKQNEVNFDILLNSISSANNLFDNPTIRIKMPNDIEKIVLTNETILYANGLTMEKPYVETNEDGTFIVISLKGKQESYNENDIGLKTDIKLSATIILNKNIKTRNDKIIFTCTNNYNINGVAEENNIEKEVSIENFNDIEKNENSNENDDKNILDKITEITEEQIKEEVLQETATKEEIEGLEVSITPLKGDNELKDGDTIYEGEFIKYNIEIKNTTSNPIDNVKIVGTIPEGVKYGELVSRFDSMDNREYEYNFDEKLTEKVINIDRINPRETINEYYEVQVGDLLEGENQKEVNTNIKTYIDNTEISNYELKNIIKATEAKVFLWSMVDGWEGEWIYGINLDNPSGKEVEIKLQLPEFFKTSQELIDGGKVYERAFSIEYSTKNNIEDVVSSGSIFLDGYTCVFNGTEVIIKTNKTGMYKIGVQAGNEEELKKLSENGTVELKAYTTVLVDGVEIKSNENRIEYNLIDVSIEMTSENAGEEVKYGEEIKYSIDVTCNNVSGIIDENSGAYVNIRDFLPESVEPISVTYDYFEQLTEELENGAIVAAGFSEKQRVTEELYREVTDEDGNIVPTVDVYTWIPYKETVNIEILTTAGLVYDKTVIENNATAQGVIIEEATAEEIESYKNFVDPKDSNTIKHIILPYDYVENEPDNPDGPDNPDNPDEPDNPSNPDDPDNPNFPDDPNAKYSISGVIWNDANGDGERQDDENLIKGISVMLVDMNNSNSVKSQIIADEGRYLFENLDKGNYIVVFRYNTAMYMLTKYKADGVLENINSDATNQTITLDGQKVNVGLTEEITLNQNMGNIDIGLIEKGGYDLKLDKYISNIVVTTVNGTKQYSYDNSKLAKVEIRSKEFNGAKVEIKYRIVITNEGKTAATVSEIYDDIPEGLSFSRGKNSNWTEQDGKLVNTSLTNQIIEPSESKEVTLTLTKTLGEEDGGTFKNKAEIGKAKGGISGTEDIDSTPGNGNISEDDYSEAEIIIGVGTGIGIYISIGTIIGIILLLVFLGIKFKVKINKISKIGLSIMLFTVIGLTTCQNVFGVQLVYTGDGVSSHGFNVYGGPFGRSTAYCNEHGRPAAGQQVGPGYNCDHSNTEYNTILSLETSSFTKSETISTGIKLEKINNGNIQVKKIGNRYILGPFSSRTNSSDEVYSIKVYDKNGKTLNYILCNANGNAVSSVNGTGNVTFYVSLSLADFNKGISKVTASQRKLQKIKKYYRHEYTVSYTYYGPSYCDYIGVNHQSQPYDNEKLIENTSETTSTWTKQEISWTNFNGTLDIEKVDKDNPNLKLNIEGTLRKNDGTFNKNFKTTNGEYHFDNLTPGTYTLTETVNNNYGYEKNEQTKISVTVTGGKANKVTMTNIKYTGNLRIAKKDIDNNNKILEGVEFKLQNSNGYVIGVDNTGKNITSAKGTVHFSNMKYTDDINQATTFVTDAKGQINIYNIRDGLYTVKEMSFGNNYGYEMDNNYIFWNNGSTSGTGSEGQIQVNRRESTVTGDTSTTGDQSKFTIMTFQNRRKYIKLSGLVWEDMISGKRDERDWEYSQGEADETNPDKLVANVTVKLKDANGNDVSFKTEDGRTVTEILTNENGSYLMVDILIDKINEYYVEFTYNGMSYASVPIVDLLPETADSSKAKENDNERTEFNNNYSTITHSGTTGPVGEARDENNDKTFDLYYDESEHYTDETGAEIDQIKSTLNYGENSVYGYEGQRFPVNMTDEQYLIKATTKDAYLDNGQSGYLSDMYTAEEIRKSSLEEIKNVNLGLYEREQPDLAIVEDIDTAKITLNGYEHTYKYNQRFDENEESDGFNVGVKFGNEYGSASYTRAIYSSDMVYNMQPENEGKLEVYITYKIALRNEATNLYTRVNEVINYYDERYDIDSIRDETGTELSYTTEESAGNGFKKVVITANQEIEHQKQNIIYITYKLQNDAVNTVLNQDVTLDSITEISSYSSYSDEDYSIHYGGVDKDSRPGSAIPENANNDSDDDNLNTYEDDTDSAPSLILQVENGRIIRGTVWEDNAIDELLANTGYDKERKGDGLYVNGENVVEKVKVELITCTDDGNPGEIATLYHKNEVVESAQMYTKDDGSYEFEGIVPGKYLIRYTYGNESLIVSSTGDKEPIETVEKYKSTIYRAGDKTGTEGMTDYWYRTETGEGNTRMSDAKDEIGINSDSTGYNIVAERIEETEENVYTYRSMTNAENPANLQNIEANTRLFDIKLDYDVNLDNISEYGAELKFIFDNIDFGIIRRPIQNLDIKKEIAWVQVKLANGQVIIEGDPRKDSINYLRYLPDGNIHIELDQELIQGATITIRYDVIVDNRNAEIDYNDEDYYIYGIVPEGNNNWKIATISNLYDYLSNGLVFDENNANNIANNWSQVELNRDLVTNGILSQEAFDAVKQFNQVLQTEAFKNMTPGQETRVPLEVSKLLSNSADDLMFTNDIEVNEVTGRKMEHDGDYTIPGNYEPSNGETGYDDDYVYLTITGPTGENRNYIQYIILGTIGLITLGAGIILIKKKVL